MYSNKDITKAFYFRELALYAKCVYYNDDGSIKSEGAETLYSYGNAGDTADLMPAYSTSTVVERQMDIVSYVGNDAQVDLTIESGVYITREQLMVELGKIDLRITDDTTGLKYKWGIDNGMVYLQEVK